MPQDPKNYGTTQIQFRASDLEDDILKRQSSYHTSPSVTAKRDLGRYYTLLDAAMPTFTRDEAHLLLDVFNGTLFEPIKMSLRLLWASLDDAENAYYEKHDVEKAAFVERVKNLSKVEVLAMIDAIERYWADAENASAESVNLIGNK